jgi:hypothetical protein
MLQNVETGEVATNVCERAALKPDFVVPDGHKGVALRLAGIPPTALKFD